jgi:hypothetical protein
VDVLRLAQDGDVGVFIGDGRPGKVGRDGEPVLPFRKGRHGDDLAFPQDAPLGGGGAADPYGSPLDG